MKTTIDTFISSGRRCSKMFAAFVAAMALAGASRSSFAQTTITDDFSTTANYSNGGSVAGSIWTGAFSGNNTSTVFDANSTNADELTLGDNGGAWDASGETGHLLYITVTGDFTASVELAGVSNAGNYLTSGLMAIDPLDLTSSPTHNFFQLGAWAYEGKVAVRYLSNNSQTDGTRIAQSDVGTGPNAYFEITRVGNVFSAYTSGDGGLNYRLLQSVTLDNMPSTLDVGLDAASFATSNPVQSAEYANFSLTYTPATIPEPATFGSFAAGLALLIAHRKFRK